MMRRPRIGHAAGVLAALAALAGSPPADAHPVGRSALVQEETAALGAEHAREHLLQRKALRRARRELAGMRPAQRRRLARTAARQRVRIAAEEPLDVAGRWESRTIDLPAYAINAALLPTGDIAFWGRPPINADGTTRDNEASFYVMDPETGHMSDPILPPKVDLDGDGVAESPAPLFCSGQSLLANGVLFVAGGNLGNPAYMGGSTPQWRGLDRAYTFDPWARKWYEQPKPRHGRWYPTQVELQDGRIAILAGFDEVGQGTKNIELEVFTPAAARDGIGTMTYYGNADRDTAFYPHMFTLPGGKVGMGGPDKADSAILDPAKLGDAGAPSPWTNLPWLQTQRVGGNAILDGSRVDLIGGAYWIGGDYDATRDSETLDFAAGSPQWTLNGNVPRMNVGRSYGNVVQTPDGGLVSVGGGAGSRASDGFNYTAYDQERKRVELLRPGGTAWRLGPAQRKWRAYHSVALLLPDGRILSAGDDYWGLDDLPHPQGDDPAHDALDIAEIYSPPYLFDGDEPAARPQITSTPGAVRYGAAFGVGVSGPDATRAVLVAPGATTHGADMNQRIVPLAVREPVPGKGLNLVAPEGPSSAPPGYYMLFVLKADGTPSVARFVRLGADAPDAPVLEPDPDPTPTPTATATATATPTATATVSPTATPVPDATPAPTPVPAADRRAPRAAATLRRSGRRLTLRLRLDEVGTAQMLVRVGDRRVRRTLRFTRAHGLRTLAIARPRKAARLRLRLTAADAAGNRRTIERAWRVPSRPR